jgi:hypothetical protein
MVIHAFVAASFLFWLLPNVASLKHINKKRQADFIPFGVFCSILGHFT